MQDPSGNCRVYVSFIHDLTECGGGDKVPCNTGAYARA